MNRQGKGLRPVNGVSPGLADYAGAMHIGHFTPRQGRVGAGGPRPYQTRFQRFGVKGYCPGAFTHSPFWTTMKTISCGPHSPVLSQVSVPSRP